MTITATTDIVVQLSASRDLLEGQVIDPQQRAYSTGNRQKVAGSQPLRPRRRC